MTSKTAEGAATTMTYTYSSPMTLHFTSVDGEVMDAITFDVLAPDSTTIAQAINDHFNTTDGISYKPVCGSWYEDSNYRVTKPLTEYAGFNELNRDTFSAARMSVTAWRCTTSCTRYFPTLRR
jgi:hypothetical protein